MSQRWRWFAEGWPGQGRLAGVLPDPRGIFYGWWIVFSASTLAALAGGVYFFGFTAFFTIVILGKHLRRFLKREEDYYDR